MLFELHREKVSTLVLVTHNMEIARMADRVIPLQDGEIVREQVFQPVKDAPTFASV